MAHNFPFKMARFLHIVLFTLLIFTWTSGAADEADDCRKPECELLHPALAHQVSLHVKGSDTSIARLKIFCYTGQQKSWTKLFVNPRMSIGGVEKQPVPGDLAIFYGDNASDVRNQSRATSLLSLNSWLLLKEDHSFHPFNLSCIGLTSTKPYTINFSVQNPEPWYLAYIAIGVIIFMCAQSWSRNIALHYTTGVTVGVLASMLLIMFLLTRLMPKRLKAVSYVVMAVSSSASLFMIQLVKTYILDIFRDHWQLALGYVLVSALISLALIYRFGPVTDVRTLNMVCWFLQATGLILVYQGTQIPEASVALILCVILFYLCPKSAPFWLKTLKFRLFPPKHHFLTEEEYIIQGQVETQRALEELRQYCRSPDCDAWRVVSRLTSPNKFASFVDGHNHINNDEILEHEDYLTMPSHLSVHSPEDSNNNADNNNDNSNANISDDDDFLNLPGPPRTPSSSSRDLRGESRRIRSDLDRSRGYGSRGGGDPRTSSGGRHRGNHASHYRPSAGFVDDDDDDDVSDVESEIEDTAYDSGRGLSRGDRSFGNRSMGNRSLNRSANRSFRH